MASILAKRLFDAGMIDMVLCFSPALVVAEDFRRELEKWTGKRFNGRVGADGCSFTYQGMSSLDDVFWEILENFRVFVIFDEIHHCAAVDGAKSNTWGETIHHYIRGKASYSLALTGTPWRSDKTPIVLADYSGGSGMVRCDYRYGLSAAMSDVVCREPSITAVDNSKIQVIQDEASNHYSSFAEFLMQSDCSYQDLLDNNTVVSEILRRANQKLDELRESVPNSGGLIVATSVRHASQIAHILYSEFNETAVTATYATENPLATIRKFRSSTSKWIISVGMISEGTNLPRLMVCCYLTRVKTELYFRQVLGRVLRSTGQAGEKGYLFMPAEPTLVEYAQRVAEDIPKSNAFTVERMDSLNSKVQILRSYPGDNCCDEISSCSEASIHVGLEESSHVVEQSSKYQTLAQSYEACINVSGAFTQKLLDIDGIDFGGCENTTVGNLVQ